MTAQASLGRLLQEIRTRVGSVSRMPQKLHVSERTVREWLKKNDPELERLHIENIENIKKAARDLGIDTDLYDSSPSLWDLSRSFKENLASDIPPVPQPATPLRNLRIAVLGRNLKSPFGASASVLTATSDRVIHLAHSGCSILTYKTVRSRAHEAHPSPNLYPCSPQTKELDPRRGPYSPILVGDDLDRFDPRFGLLNRFGMPSAPPEVWRADFRRTKSFLTADQLLILSVTGTAAPEESTAVLLEDFVEVTGLASEAGADVIELNLSCPNCSGQEGLVFENLQLASEICKAVRTTLPGIKLIAKIGYMKKDALFDFVLATAQYLDGYTAINTLPVEGQRAGMYGQLEPAFNQPGLRAGLSGPPIRRLGLEGVDKVLGFR